MIVSRVLLAGDPADAAAVGTLWGVAPVIHNVGSGNGAAKAVGIASGDISTDEHC
jgi:hypothetical protein